MIFVRLHQIPHSCPEHLYNEARIFFRIFVTFGSVSCKFSFSILAPLKIETAHSQSGTKMGFNEISAPTVQVMAPGQIDPWKPGKIRYGEAIEQANTILPHAHAGCKVCFCGPCNYPSCCSCWVQRSLQIPCPIFLCVLPRFNPDGLCIIPTLCGVPIPICCGSHTLSLIHI